MTHSSKLAACCLLAAIVLAPVARADMLVLEQIVPADAGGTAFLLIDRDRLALARVRKEKGTAHVVELTLATEPTITLSLNCSDQAAARQLLDALRAPGMRSIDVTSRCRL